MQTMAPKEWSNFKERLKAMIPDIDVNTLNEGDFAQVGLTSLPVGLV